MKSRRGTKDGRFNPDILVYESSGTSHSTACHHTHKHASTFIFTLACSAWKDLQGTACAQSTISTNTKARMDTINRKKGHNVWPSICASRWKTTFSSYFKHKFIKGMIQFLHFFNSMFQIFQHFQPPRHCSLHHKSEAIHPCVSIQSALVN